MKTLLTLAVASLFALSVPAMARGNIEKGKKSGANLITDLPMWDVQSSDVIVNTYR
jgi:hypothetical protein